MTRSARKREAKQKTKRSSHRDCRLTRKTPKPRRGRRVADKALEQALRAVLPRFVTPCLATLVDKAPEGKRWEHELKFDGYRTRRGWTTAR